jgi:hypothetical protein
MNSNMQEYDRDFSELIQIPAASAARSFDLIGVPRHRTVRFLGAMNMQVGRYVYIASDVNRLGCIAPEQITEQRLVHELSDILPRELGKATWACIRKATDVLRGEMTPAPEWPLLAVDPMLANIEGYQPYETTSTGNE